MITIKDPALGKYSVIEDYQGFKVKDESGKQLVAVNSFEDALRFIAQKLVLESDATLSLKAYTRMRKEVFDRIVAAQETDGQEESPIAQQVIQFGDNTHE
jgi:hypothetical protein